MRTSNQPHGRLDSSASNCANHRSARRDCGAGICCTGRCICETGAWGERCTLDAGCLHWAPASNGPWNSTVCSARWGSELTSAVAGRVFDPSSTQSVLCQCERTGDIAVALLDRWVSQAPMHLPRPDMPTPMR